MPRYHFNLHDGNDQPDADGLELPGIVEARRCAVRLLGDVLREADDSFWQAEEWRLEVTNADGLVLFTLNVLATDSPASRR